MSQITELEQALLALEAIEPEGNMCTPIQRQEIQTRRMQAMLAFVKAATPRAVRALLDERDRLAGR